MTMEKKIILISEALSAPFDEGIKNVAFSLHKQLGVKIKTLTVTNAENNTEDLKINKIRLNKLFLNKKLWEFISINSPDTILYLPASSCSFYSFVRAKVLKMMYKNAKVVLFGVQPRNYSAIQYHLMMRFLRPDLLLLLGKYNREVFIKCGLNVKVLPPAVDTVKFRKATAMEKERIRAEYNIPGSKTVVLHVGHIKKTRNIECLIDIQKIDGIQVVIVGSTTTETENSLKDALIEEGITIIDRFIPDISDIYKMSDIYVFPVFLNNAAIEMPLSVLEAMSCNLPVITTKFGELVDYFKEGSGFRYFNTIEELVDLIQASKNMDNSKINNDKNMERFTWERFADETLSACEEL